ncbi:phage tail tape measure protein [Enterococcus wangshanyuanii]|uniref:Phage tail tape measure protein n=1 Tax=Enterococcus wangshanyuanii TaxID=2005703 RepID=A0ABQ1NT07_9ENTE|nr:phage tail tape measure protein [Enterococcus wangshanyuanii]
MANKNNETKVTFKVYHKEFRQGIQEMEGDAKKLRQEMKLESEQLKVNGTETQKLTAALGNLEKQYEVAKNKTEATEKALEETKRLFGDNSEAVAKMEKELRSAQIAEQQLANKVSVTSDKLKEAKQAESDRAQQMQQLKSEQESLASSSEKLNKEYDLQKAALGNNATEAQKAKLEQQRLADQMKNSADQVDNLEKQLSLAKKEFGENSTEVDKLEKELLDAKLASQEFTNEYKLATDGLKNFSDKAKNIGSGMQNVGKSYSMGITAPIVAGTALSVKAASDFESAFAGVKKTVDEAVDSNGKVTVSYGDLEKGIRDMAKELPASAAEISAVAESAGQLGIKTENVLSFTKTMVDLGESTNMSADEAATALARLANITGMPQSEFDKLGATIVDLGNNFATTESEITAMGLRLAGAGNQVGMSEAEIMSFAAALSSVGVEAEAGGSAFSKVMVQMQLAVEKGGGAFDDLKETAAKAGLSWESVSNAIRVGGKELTSVSGQMGLTSSELKKMVKDADKSASSLDNFADVAGMSSEQFSKAFKEDATGAIISFIKGLSEAEKHGTTAIKVLDDMDIKEVRLRDSLLRASGASDVFSDAVKTGTEAWGENTALTDEASKRYETFESKLKMVKNQVTDLGIEFGGPLMDALSDMLDALKPLFEMLTKVAEAFSNADPMVQKIIMSVVALVAAIGPLLIFFGKIATSIGAIAGLFVEGGALAGLIPWVTGTLLPALGSIVTVIFSWPVLIGAAIAALVFIIVKYWDEIVDFTTKTFNGIAKFFSETWEGVSKSVADAWNNIISTVSEFFSGLIDGIVEKWQAFHEAISSKLSDLGKWFSETWTGIKQVVADFWNSLIEMTKPFIDTFVKIITVPISLMQTALEAIWLLIVAGATIAWEAIKIATQWAWEQIVKYIIDPIVSVYDFIVQKLTDLYTWLNEKWNEIVMVTRELWQMFKEGVITPVVEVYVAVINKIGELWNGLVNWFSKIKDSAVEIFTNVKDGIVLKITEAKEGVINIASGIWQGLTEKFEQVVSMVTEKFNKVKEAIMTPLRQAKDYVGKMIGDIVDFFKKIKFPSFGLKTSTKKVLGKEITYPSGIDVKWNAKGALFKRPVVAGMYGGQAQGFGEAGQEAAIPLTPKVLGEIGQSIMASLGNKEIMSPVLDGLSMAAQEKMSTANKEEKDSSQAVESLLAKMEALLEMLGQQSSTPEVHNHFGKVDLNNPSELMKLDRQMYQMDRQSMIDTGGGF